MAEFDPEYRRTLAREGGMKLTNIAADKGGMTFAGISRVHHPAWEGWPLVDAGDRDSVQLSEMVRAFYKREFWDRIRGDEIDSQVIAGSLYDFAVNASVRTATTLAQIAVGADPDGRVGAETLSKLDDLKTKQVSAEELFALRFFLAKISHYAKIVDGDRRRPPEKRQGKFLAGWVNRALEGVR